MRSRGNSEALILLVALRKGPVSHPPPPSAGHICLLLEFPVPPTIPFKKVGERTDLCISGG